MFDPFGKELDVPWQQNIAIGASNKSCRSVLLSCGRCAGFVSATPMIGGHQVGVNAMDACV